MHMVIFTEQDHVYRAGAEHNAGVTFYSVSGFISAFHDKFPSDAADKASRNAKNKWYGIPPDKIRELWRAESERSTRIGHMVHARKEADLLAKKSVKLFDRELPVWPCLYNERGEKLSFNQRLYDGVHPEALLYRQLSDTVGLAGQSDVPVFYFTETDESAAVIHIGDYKTNKELKYDNDFRNMYYPFDDMPDSNYWHYVIQLNTYARLVQLNNPGTAIGRLVINHVEFKVLSRDRYDFPVIEMDQSGYPVISGINKIDLPVFESDRMDEAFRVFVESRHRDADASALED